MLKRRNDVLMYLMWSLWDPEFFTRSTDVFNERINQDMIIQSAVDLLQKLDGSNESPTRPASDDNTLLTSILNGTFLEIGNKLETNSRNLASN